MSKERRTEQEHINTPADNFGTNMTADFGRSETPKTEQSEKMETATNGRADKSPDEPTANRSRTNRQQAPT